MLNGKARREKIIVREEGGLRILQFGRTLQSTMSVDDPALGGLEYTDFFHVPFILRESIGKVLFIGLGGGTGPKQFLHHYPELVIDVVEVDPDVIDVARKKFGVEAGSRLSVHLADGRIFIRHTRRRYDVIYLDAYSTERRRLTIPAHLTTVEFFEECGNRLSDDGIVLFNCAARREWPIRGAIAETLSRVFPFVSAFEVLSEDNILFLASRSPLETDPRKLASLARRKFVSGEVPLRRLAGRMKQTTAVRRGSSDSIVLTDAYAPVDELMRPGKKRG